MKKTFNSNVKTHLAYITSILVAALIVTTVVVGCSKKKGRRSSPPQGENKQEVLALLSQEQSRAFEAWKMSLLKSCDPHLAFGLKTAENHQTEDSMDFAVLMSLTGNSLVLRESSPADATLAGWTLIGIQPQLGAYSSEKSVNEELTFDGQTRTFEAKTSQKGSLCEMFLFGQKVAEVLLVPGLTIESSWKPAKEIEPLIMPALPVRSVRGDTMEERDFPAQALVAKALKPEPLDIEVLAVRLGIVKDQASRFIKISESNSTNRTLVRPRVEAGGVWSFLSSTFLIGTKTSLSEILPGEARTTALELRVRAPGVLVRAPGVLKLGEIFNSADTFSIFGELNIEIKNGENQVTAKVLDFQMAGLKPLEAAEANQCLVDRTGALLLLRATNGTQGPLKPGFEDAFGPCRLLAQSTDSIAEFAPAAPKVFPKILGGFTPTIRSDFSGWDVFLLQLVEDSLKKGENPLSKLDPEARIPHLPEVVQAMLDAQVLLKDLVHLKETPYFGKFSDLAAGWALLGQKSTTAELRNVLEPIDKVIVALSSSAETLITDIRDGYQAHTGTIDFANSLNVEDLNSVVAVRSQAEELELTSWSQNKLSTYLQMRITRDQTNAWLNSLKSAKEFFNRESGRKNPKFPTLSEDDIKRVLENGVENGWTVNNYSAMENLAFFGRKLEGKFVSGTTASEFVTDMGFDVFSTRPGKLLSVELSGRYVNLVGFLDTAATSLSSNISFTSVVDDLKDALFSGKKPLWADLSDADFNSNSRQLKNFYDQYLAADFFERIKIEKNIDALLNPLP